MEPDDVLADHVEIGRPEPVEQIRVGVGEAGPGEVVRQRVDPDVHDVVGWPGTFTPQSKVVREIERSRRPPGTKLKTSLRRMAGRMNSGCSS